jgi:hypothetical protein
MANPSMAATIARDLAVDLQNDRPGMLAKAAEAIASGGLNLDGFAELEGILHILTSDARSARLALEAVGLRVVAERDVVVAEVEDHAGAAAAVFGRLAESRINVAYAYVASRNRLIIAADDAGKAIAALRG